MLLKNHKGLRFQVEKESTELWWPVYEKSATLQTTTGEAMLY
jgi:hypothetical protein